MQIADNPDRPDALADHLDRHGLVPRDADWTALTGGRSNRSWRVEMGDGTLTVKLYPRADTNPLFRNDPGAETQMLSYLDGLGLAPRLRGFVETPLGQCLVYHHVTGAPWAKDTPPVARLFTRLHGIAPPPGPPPGPTSGLLPGLPLAPDGSAELAAQTLDILSRCPPDQARDLRHLRPDVQVPASGQRALLHGDCVPGNLIVSPAGMFLIDWQCPAVGDPSADIAVFLSPAMQLVYRGQPLTQTEVDVFLNALDRPEVTQRYRALAPWYHWRMTAYCLWKLSNGALEYAPALNLERRALAQ